jgi:hypothetical protein
MIVSGMLLLLAVYGRGKLNNRLKNDPAILTLAGMTVQ